MFIKKTKGFTLVEVIVSLIILSVAVVSLLSFFASGYQNILNLRGANVENAKIQKYFEEEMAKAKKDGIPITDTELKDYEFKYVVSKGTTSSDGSVNVKLKEIQYKEKPEKKISIYVAQRKEAVLEIPGSISAEIPNAKKYYYVGQTIPEPKVTVTAADSSKQVIDHRDGWLMSKLTVGVQESVTVGSIATGSEATSKINLDGRDTEVTKIVPDMANTSTDSIELPNINRGKALTVTDEMRRKFITYGARLFNSYGRVGAYQTAERIWILGLPIVDSLVAHSDADLATTVTGSGIPISDKPVEDVQVENHADGKAFTQVIPVLSVYEKEIDQIRQFFALDNKTLKIAGINAQTDGLTTVINLRGSKQSGNLLTYEFGAYDGRPSTLFIKLNIGESGKLTLTTTNASNASSSVELSKELSVSNDNTLTMVTGKPSNGKLKWVVYVNGNQAGDGELAVRASDMGSAAVSFGGQTYINEFAVYQKDLTTSQKEAVETYYKNKYKK